METVGSGTVSTAWAITGIVIFAFMWLIPLIHVSRSKSLIPTIEVMLLLGASILLPIGAGALSSPSSMWAGVVFFVPLVGATLLWFAALAIALFAELGERLR